MSIPIYSPIDLNSEYANLDSRYVDSNGNPFVSKEAAETALNRRLNKNHVGLTVLVQQQGEQAKEYWVQPVIENGETIYRLVKKDTSDYTDLSNKPAINGVQLSGDKTPAQLGLATANQVETLSNKVDKLPTGYYYGKFDSVEDLPEATEKGYAYVASSDPTVFYTYLVSGAGAEWVDSGNKMVNTVDLTTPKTTETELSKGEKYFASANINDRPADVVIETGVVKSLGYKVLNFAMSFAEQVTEENTIYEIKHEFNLKGGGVTIPAGCILRFNGGKLVNGTIDFNGCFIDSLNVPIFGTDMEFANVNVKNTELVATWFGFTPDNPDATIISKIIDFGCNLFIPRGVYELTSTIIKSTSNLGSIRGDSKNTWLKSITCDIFAVKKLDISQFTIKGGDGYYGIKDTNGYLKVFDNDIRTCGVGIGNELGTKVNKMESDIFNNTIQYCTDSGIKYKGSISGDSGTNGFISGLTIENNYIVKCGTGVDDYTSDGTTDVGYGIYLEDLYTFICRRNIVEYCSYGGIVFKQVAYVVTNGSIENNILEQNKRCQIEVYVSTASTIRGLIVNNNSSSYPLTKVSNFLKEYLLNGFGVYESIGNNTNQNNIFGFGYAANKLLTISDLYKYATDLVSIGVLTKGPGVTAVNLSNNASIELYKSNQIRTWIIGKAEAGKKYIVEFDLKRHTSVTNYLYLTLSCGGVSQNVSDTTLPANATRHYYVFVCPNTSGNAVFTGYIEGGGQASTYTELLYSISNVSIREGDYAVVSEFSRIKGINQYANGCKIYLTSATTSNKTRVYDGTQWLDEDGEPAGIKRTGSSSERPSNANVGFKYFDSTIGKPIFWDGTAWVDANGETVGLQVSDTSVLIGAAADSTKTVSVYYGGSTAPTITVLNSDDTANTWLTAVLTNNTLTLTAAANSTSAPRGAKVLVTLGDELVIINVVQSY